MHRDIPPTTNIVYQQGAPAPAEGSISMTLREVQIGQSAKVVKLNGTGPVKRRIMDMGITKGQLITVIRVAPLGDPMEITVRNYELSVRKADAEMIEVELVEEA